MAFVVCSALLGLGAKGGKTSVVCRWEVKGGKTSVVCREEVSNSAKRRGNECMTTDRAAGSKSSENTPVRKPRAHQNIDMVVLMRKDGRSARRAGT